MVLDTLVMFAAIAFSVLVIVALKEFLFAKHKKGRDDDETQ